MQWLIILVLGVVLYIGLEQRRIFISQLEKKTLPDLVCLGIISTCDTTLDIAVGLALLGVAGLYGLRAYRTWTLVNVIAALPFVLEGSQVMYGASLNFRMRRAFNKELQALDDSKISETERYAVSIKKLLLDHFKHSLHPVPHRASLLSVMIATLMVVMVPPSLETFDQFITCLVTALRLPVGWTAAGHVISNSNIAFTAVMLLKVRHMLVSDEMSVGDVWLSPRVTWFWLFLAVWILTAIVWRLEGWLVDESDLFLHLRDMLESLGISYRRRVPEKVRGRGTTMKKLIQDTSKGDGGIQGFATSDLLQDELGFVGHEFHDMMISDAGGVVIKKRTSGLQTLKEN
eukprot:Blabericola_migrator_1__11632@NODE_69_length_15356_cov_75_151481_g62_i0_p6_GENE_NODE_69_length_15356_cov_75_151481_g62_i0NODE_69_length_15356_cov_75_151481_g62_i0_p6_ORF_typecomplete_len345_score43_83_NODE_69_length_15356_cov_75_151481_g62_i027663800